MQTYAGEMVEESLITVCGIGPSSAKVILEMHTSSTSALLVRLQKEEEEAANLLEKKKK
jgi:hypothetical protein